MKTQAIAALVAAVLVTAFEAKADDAPPRPAANPDAAALKLTPPHFFVQLGGGASFSSVDVGDMHFISTHAHFDLALGHEVLVTPVARDRLAIGLGYAGSLDVSSDEMLQRHGAGVTFRRAWLFATLSGGFSVLQGFSDGSVFTGGHLGVVWGVRVGPVQLGFPVYVDFFTAPVATFAATLGFQI